jgi:hypothetical protein
VLQRSTIFVLALALTLPDGGAAAKDLMVRQRTTASGTAPFEQTQYFTARTMVTDDPHVRMILDLDAKQLTLADKDRRVYSLMTFDELHRLSEAAADRLDDLPADERKRFGLDAPVSVKPTGRTQTIAGHPSREYTVDAGPAKGKIWMSEDLPLPDVAREWERLGASIGGERRAGAKLAAALAKLHGIPMRTAMTITMGPQKAETTTEVLEVREAAPPAELLRVPEGFTKGPPPSIE